MRIRFQVEPGGSTLNPRQCDLLDRIEADSPDVDGLFHREGHHLHRHCLKQAQDLNELALPLVAHPHLKEMPQVLEVLRQGPVLKRGGLIERAWLGLDQR